MNINKSTNNKKSEFKISEIINKDLSQRTQDNL